MGESKLSSESRHLLGLIYCDMIESERSTIHDLLKRTTIDARYLRSILEEFEKLALIKGNGDGFQLTDVGRSQIRVAFAGGVFDIVHPGHIHTLKASRNLGDILIVSVARDSTVVERKGRPPVNDEVKRREMVSSLRCVDLAVLGSETSIFDTVMRVSPDVIALGYDQRHQEKEIIIEAERRGLKIEVVRLGSPIPGVKSSKVIKNNNRILEEI